MKVRLRAGQLLLKLGRISEARAVAISVLTGSSEDPAQNKSNYGKQASHILRTADKLSKAEGGCKESLRRAERLLKLPTIGAGRDSATASSSSSSRPQRPSARDVNRAQDTAREGEYFVVIYPLYTLYTPLLPYLHLRTPVIHIHTSYIHLTHL